MAHHISGIITSFKYDGELPNIVLVGNYYFLPLERESRKNFHENSIEPYEELTSKTRKILKELSFTGNCAYIETDYFGGSGTQLAEVWENGRKITDTFFSYSQIENLKIPKGVVLVEASVNEALKRIGIYCHEGKDEFDSIGLGKYRSNGEILDACDDTINCD